MNAMDEQPGTSPFASAIPAPTSSWRAEARAAGELQPCDHGNEREDRGQVAVEQDQTPTTSPERPRMPPDNAGELPLRSAPRTSPMRTPRR